jgi:hypothetical protein
MKEQRSRFFALQAQNNIFYKLFEGALTLDHLCGWVRVSSHNRDDNILAE